VRSDVQRTERKVIKVIVNIITGYTNGTACPYSTLVKWNGQTQHMHFAYRMGFCFNSSHSTTAIADGGPLHKENIL